GLSARNNGFSLLGFCGYRRDRLASCDPPGFSLRFAVVEIRHDQDAEHGSEKLAITGIVVGRPYEFLRTKRSGGCELVSNGAEIRDHELLPALRIATHDRACPQTPELASAGNYRGHHHRFELIDHQVFKLVAEVVPHQGLDLFSLEQQPYSFFEVGLKLICGCPRACLSSARKKFLNYRRSLPARLDMKVENRKRRRYGLVAKSFCLFDVGDLQVFGCDQVAGCDCPCRKLLDRGALVSPQ